MLEDDLWLDNARAANAAAQTLAEAAPERLVYPVEANEVSSTSPPKKPRSSAARGSISTIGDPAKSGS